MIARSASRISINFACGSRRALKCPKVIGTRISALSRSAAPDPTPKRSWSEGKLPRGKPSEHRAFRRFLLTTISGCAEELEIPVWGFLVFLLYTTRRVGCRRCGVVAAEEVPWGDGKRTLTKAYMLFLALGRAVFHRRKLKSAFALPGIRCSMPSKMSWPGGWNTAGSVRSTPSVSINTPKATGT